MQRCGETVVGCALHPQILDDDSDEEDYGDDDDDGVKAIANAEANKEAGKLPAATGMAVAANTDFIGREPSIARPVMGQVRHLAILNWDWG
jgi:hypothetical protein